MAVACRGGRLGGVAGGAGLTLLGLVTGLHGLAAAVVAPAKDPTEKTPGAARLGTKGRENDRDNEAGESAMGDHWNALLQVEPDLVVIHHKDAAGRSLNLAGVFGVESGPGKRDVRRRADLVKPSGMAAGCSPPQPV